MYAVVQVSFCDQLLGVQSKRVRNTKYAQESDNAHEDPEKLISTLHIVNNTKPATEKLVVVCESAGAGRALAHLFENQCIHLWMLQGNLNKIVNPYCM